MTPADREQSASAPKPSKGGGLWRFARNVAIGYAALALLAYVFQRRLQYMPDRGPVAPPAGPQGRGLEEVQVTASDGVRLRGWHWPGERPVTLLILPGNAGHRGYRLEWIDDLRSLGLGVCIVDYRGYGGSEGSPTEEGLYRDAEAAAAWLEERARASGRPARIVYLGESIGCAVAVELALRRPPAALILQSSFSSAADVGQRAYPFLPVKLLLKDRFDAASRIGRVAAPKLFLHGDSDGIVPMRFGRRLFDAAADPKEWHEVPGAGHNDVPWVG
ncbi:MAG: alpha/beta hydrolase, partial [Planctomycetes bacterium]|nr:alpha/beta hydrolase [Planctomycetota bacterium]